MRDRREMRAAVRSPKNNRAFCNYRELFEAVRWYLDRQAANSGLAVEFVSVSLKDDDRFPAALETTCFRIVQEGITNVMRHARANRISVRLERTGDDLMLIISDDGAGFDRKPCAAPETRTRRWGCGESKSVRWQPVEL